MDEKKFNMEFSLVELQGIVDALKKLPYEQSAPVIENIMKQYNAIISVDKEETIKKE